MPFENFTHGRIIIHEVFRRDDDRRIVDRRYGSGLVTLDRKAASAFQNRLVTTLGDASSCVEMSIAADSTDSMFQLAKTLMDADKPLFIRESRKVADKLASAQTTRLIPGGVLVVFTGTVGSPKKRMLGVIKAEPHDGFVRETKSDGSPGLRFLEDLFLTPVTRLYKIGVFIESDPDAATPERPSAGHRAFVYDELMTSTNRQKAAQYFYESFLGCEFPDSGARMTRLFYNYTKDFIAFLDVPEEKKTDLYTALRTYLKTDTRPVVEVAGFASAYFPEVRQDYETFMAAREFPLHAVPKDLADLGNALRTRRVLFSKNIKLTAPADTFEEMVRIETIAGTRGPDRAPAKWTKITVKDHIRSQE